MWFKHDLVTCESFFVTSGGIFYPWRGDETFQLHESTFCGNNKKALPLRIKESSTLRAGTLTTWRERIEVARAASEQNHGER